MALLKYVLLGVVIVGMLAGIVLRLANPDMTEVRAFLTFWPLWVVIWLATLGFFLLERRWP